MRFIFSMLCLLVCLPLKAETIDLTKPEMVELTDISIPQQKSSTKIIPHIRKPSLIVNINTSTLSELENLPGIGPIKARAILDYRKEHGDFITCKDLVRVKGIGEKTLEKLKDICVTK